MQAQPPGRDRKVYKYECADPTRCGGTGKYINMRVQTQPVVAGQESILNPDSSLVKKTTTLGLWFFCCQNFSRIHILNYYKIENFYLPGG